MTKRILRNSAHCLSCGDNIESKHRHDWVECSCGNVFVDGGKDYIRRGFINEDLMEDTSVVEGDEWTTAESL